MGTQGLGQTLMLGKAEEYRSSRARVRIWALFGSTRESWRSWGSGKIKVADLKATADLVLPGSFVDNPSSQPSGASTARFCPVCSVCSLSLSVA